MSATMRRLEWAVTVEDTDHWTAEDLQAANADTEHGSYDEWAVAGLVQAMQEAGEAFIAAHPERFAVGLT